MRLQGTHRPSVLPTARVHAAFLILQGGRQGALLRFEEPEMIFGRSPDGPLPILDRRFSRRHARIFRQGHAICIEDLGSTNGTLVDGKPIQSITELREGSIVQMGERLLLRFDRYAEEELSAFQHLLQWRRRVDESENLLASPAVERSSVQPLKSGSWPPPEGYFERRTELPPAHAPRSGVGAWFAQRPLVLGIALSVALALGTALGVIAVKAGQPNGGARSEKVAAAASEQKTHALPSARAALPEATKALPGASETQKSEREPASAAGKRNESESKARATAALERGKSAAEALKAKGAGQETKAKAGELKAAANSAPTPAAKSPAEAQAPLAERRAQSKGTSRGAGSRDRRDNIDVEGERLASVIQAKRTSLQRCYSMTHTSTSSTLRLDIEMTVAASGGISGVQVQGNAPSDLIQCIRDQVQRWELPAAQSAKTMQFPVVFRGTSSL